MCFRLKNKKLCFILSAILLAVLLCLFYWFSNKDMLIIQNDSSNTITHVKIHINDSNQHISDTVIIKDIKPHETRKVKMESPPLKNSRGSWALQYEINQRETGLRHFANDHAPYSSNRIELRFNDSEIDTIEGLVIKNSDHDILFDS